MTVPWIITDEDPWMPDGRYDGPGQLMLVSPSGRGHLAFHEGVWYRVRQSGLQALQPEEAVLLRPIDIDVILSISHLWMINSPRSELAMDLSTGLKNAAKQVVVYFAQAAGALS
jgi:hypothetical protein